MKFWLQTLLNKYLSPLSHTDAQYIIWKSLQILNGVVFSQKRSSTFKFVLFSFGVSPICLWFQIDPQKDFTLKFIVLLTCKSLFGSAQCAQQWLISQSINFWIMVTLLKFLWMKAFNLIWLHQKPFQINSLLLLREQKIKLSYHLGKKGWGKGFFFVSLDPLGWFPTLLHQGWVGPQGHCFS